MSSQPFAAIPLGPFDLIEIAGVGGMGKVWRAIHRREGIAVAVKVLTVRAARDPLFVRFFRNEVRSVAGLDHPNIVTVFDHGVVSPAAAESAPRELVAGSPYLAMEWASGPTLVDRLPMSSWEELRGVALSLLDALAHAHARGVIHRDLKPANILFAAAGDLRPGLKLVDFGIARPPDSEEEPGWQTGTPGYMAPEQITGETSALGPWTDLYALGAILFRASGGTPPFQASDGPSLMAAHLSRPLPPLFPLFPVPQGFEEWLQGLLAKRADQRFQRSADAAVALLRLGSPLETGAPTSDEAFDSHEAATLAEPATTLAVFRDVPIQSLSPGHSARATAQEPPPLPARWQRAPRDSLRLHGAGLGVYGLRTVPMVNREFERDSLWQALHRVHDRQRAEAVLLLGPAGFGKTRLAAWLSRRAHEVGGAIVLRADHGELPAPAHGLVAALARHLGTVGMSWGDACVHAGRALRELGIHTQEDNRSLAEMVASASQGRADETRTPSALAFPARAERWLLVRTVMERLAERRPVLLWLDNVHWGADALGFTRRLLEMQSERPSRVLVVMTAREEALPGRPVEEHLLDLLPADSVSSIHVGPLAPVDRSTLLRELLGLDGTLASRVEERTAGNPLFAVQLVGGLVQSDQLRLGPGGFDLRPGAELALPDDVQGVWSERVERLMGGASAASWNALELAAVLGQDVNLDEWSTVCRHAGSEPSPALVEAMLSERLAHPAPGGPEHGWSFAHGMLRESLLSRARDGGRLVAHHRACARALREIPGTHGEERLGRHLLAAGEGLAAIDPLFAGAMAREAAGETQAAGALLREREAAMEAVGLDPADERWGRGWVLHSRVAQLGGAREEVEVWTRRAEEGAATHNWVWCGAAAALNRGRISLRGGDPHLARPTLEEAVERASSAGDRRLLAECRRALAGALNQLGELDASVECFSLALEDSNAVGDDRGAGSACLGIGLDATARGDFDVAHQFFEHAEARFVASGSRWGVALAWNFEGDIARYRGDLAAAESWYAQAIERHIALGTNNSFLAMLNMCALRIESGEFEEALAVLEKATRIAVRAGWTGMTGVSHLHRAVALGGLGRWPECISELHMALEAIRTIRIRERDIARLARILGDFAAAAGESELAVLAFRLSLEQWSALNREERAAEIRARLEAVGYSE